MESSLEIANRLHQLLAPHGLRLAVAESVTAGRVQSLVTSVSGSSIYFQGGLTAYHLEQKVRLLGVDRGAATACNCVSPLIAQQMARGVCNLFDAHLGLATTGYAEPSPDYLVSRPLAHAAVWWIDPEKPDHGTLAAHATFHADDGLDRSSVQQAFAESAVKLLLDVRSLLTR